MTIGHHTIKKNNKGKVGVADENGDYKDVIGKLKEQYNKYDGKI